jgi:hypothetical protein
MDLNGKPSTQKKTVLAFEMLEMFFSEQSQHVDNFTNYL